MVNIFAVFTPSEDCFSHWTKERLKCLQYCFYSLGVIFLSRMRLFFPGPLSISLSLVSRFVVAVPLPKTLFRLSTVLCLIVERLIFNVIWLKTMLRSVFCPWNFFWHISQRYTIVIIETVSTQLEACFCRIYQNLVPVITFDISTHYGWKFCRK